MENNNKRGALLYYNGRTLSLSNLKYQRDTISINLKENYFLQNKYKFFNFIKKFKFIRVILAKTLRQSLNTFIKIMTELYYFLLINYLKSYIYFFSLTHGIIFIQQSYCINLFK